jgi:hypothetical protein
MSFAIKWAGGVDQGTIDEFLAEAEKGHGATAGKYFKGDKYRVIPGNAAQAGWGNLVPPGYEKIGYTNAQMVGTVNHHGDNRRMTGEDTLILKRSQDPAPQQQAQAAAQPRGSLATPDALASAREAYDRANFYAAASPSSGAGFNASLSGPDLYQSIADAGAKQNEHYTRRFLPQLEARAKLGAGEVGFATQQAINSLPDDIKVPKYEDIFAKGGLYERLRADIA